jgi:hypothetical protein
MDGRRGLYSIATGKSAPRNVTIRRGSDLFEPIASANRSSLIAQLRSYAMDGDKDDKSLFAKAIESVKDIASSITEAVKSAPPSTRPENAIPVEENLDAPRMTAEELAEHAAADTQPVTSTEKAGREKTTSPNLSGRITPTYDFPPPDFPMPSSKKRRRVVKKAKKPAKAAKKKAVKQAAKKTAKKAKKATPKKSAKKSKKARKKSKP